MFVVLYSDVPDQVKTETIVYWCLYRYDSKYFSSGKIVKIVLEIKLITQHNMDS